MTASAADARRCALRLLAYRGRSERELRERLLAKGFDESTVTSVIESLRRAGLLDDVRLAEELKRQASEQRLLGHAMTRRYLRLRGVPEEVVRATDSYDEEEELARARRLAEKKLRTLSGVRRTAAESRLYQYLARRGYAADIIHKVMREIAADARD